jgi:hypothetical protein
LSGQQPIR